VVTGFAEIISEVRAALRVGVGVFTNHIKPMQLPNNNDGVQQKPGDALR
jgi:hypothetical protein